MGKSMGNFITIKDALLRHEPEALRLYYAMSHYRSQLEYDETHIAQAEQVLERIRTVYNEFSNLLDKSTSTTSSEADIVRKIISQTKSDFDEAMDDDFNTPRALASMIGFAKGVEPYANNHVDKGTIGEILKLFSYFGSVFGILQSKGTAVERSFEKLLNMVLGVRDDARKKGDWKTSDNIRDSLRYIGVIIEDTAEGIRWHLKPVTESST
jgi:cysteinyl-tRNA synthetase